MAYIMVLLLHLFQIQSINPLFYIVFTGTYLRSSCDKYNVVIFHIFYVTGKFRSCIVCLFLFCCISRIAVSGRIGFCGSDRKRISPRGLFHISRHNCQISLIRRTAGIDAGRRNSIYVGINLDIVRTGKVFFIQLLPSPVLHSAALLLHKAAVSMHRNLIQGSLQHLKLIICERYIPGTQIFQDPFQIFRTRNRNHIRVFLKKSVLWWPVSSLHTLPADPESADSLPCSQS